MGIETQTHRKMARARRIVCGRRPGGNDGARSCSYEATYPTSALMWPHPKIEK